MSAMNKNLGLLLVGAVLGAVLYDVGGRFITLPGTHIQDSLGDAVSVETAVEKKPLYWVAPMDPNYRRDKPGQSPMGMDLIAVYEKAVDSADEGPGTLKISPEVINNLGVRTADAVLSSLQFDVRTVGYVQYNQDQVVHIHPRVEGWVEKIYIKAEGDPVEKGQPLYELYSPALVNAQEELLFSLARGDRRLIQAAEVRLKSLQVSVGKIAELKKTGKATQTVTFYAPMSGVVDNFTIREGLFVKPGTTLMSIGSLDDVWIEAEVFERQASMVAVGLPVTIRLDYLPGKVWQGVVDYVYPTLDAKTRALKVRMRFPNPERELKPNMFAEVVIQNESDQLTLTVPREALIRVGNTNRVVLALGDGRFKSIEVIAGLSDGQQVEILDGLSEGEQVVTSAQFLLDSESSKTSDFMRMHNEEMPMSESETGSATEMASEERDVAEEMQKPPLSVWSEATINKVLAADRKLNLDHAAIEAWQWPAMTMDFNVAESVPIASLRPGMMLHVEISKDADGKYQISNVHIPDQSGQQE